MRAQLGEALEVIRRHEPARILTLGGEFAVSVAPFMHLRQLLTGFRLL